MDPRETRGVEGGGGRGGEEGDAVAQAAAAGDIPDVEVEEGDGRGGGVVHAPVKGGGVGKGPGPGKGGVNGASRVGQGVVKDMLQASSNGKVSGRVVSRRVKCGTGANRWRVAHFMYGPVRLLRVASGAGRVLE